MHISPGKFIFEHGICVWFFKSCVLFGDRFSSPVINISHRQCVTRHTAHIHIHILHASPRTAVEWFRMGLFFFWVLCEVCHRNMLKCIKELYVCACPCHMNEMECHMSNMSNTRWPNMRYAACRHFCGKLASSHVIEPFSNQCAEKCISHGKAGKAYLPSVILRSVWMGGGGEAIEAIEAMNADEWQKTHFGTFLNDLHMKKMSWCLHAVKTVEYSRTKCLNRWIVLLCKHLFGYSHIFLLSQYMHASWPHLSCSRRWQCGFVDLPSRLQTRFWVTLQLILPLFFSIILNR